MTDKTILVAGTYDTKDDELTYLCERITGQGGGVLTMDVSVLGDPSQPTDVSKHQVAEAGGSSIREAIDSGDENVAMQIMARGAVLGAARAVEPPKRDRPLIGMTSFGKTVLRYMVTLKPELEKRGYEVAVFHATGMGGRAFESLAAEGAFAAVMDFAPQEVSNHMFGGLSAGEDRMTNAGRMGIPQLVAPGCYDLIDYVGWQPAPPQLSDRPSHAHNRLLTSAVLTAEERRRVAREICGKLADAMGPVALLLPRGGCNEWDRPDADLHDAEGLAAFCDEVVACCPANVRLEDMAAHINDAEFTDAALAVFDGWVEAGVIPRP